MVLQDRPKKLSMDTKVYFNVVKSSKGFAAEVTGAIAKELVRRIAPVS